MWGDLHVAHADEALLVVERRGERETAYMLDHQFGPDNDRNLLIHDLRLPDGQGGFAQFDHILLSRASRTASIFESKNYSGRISKNEKRSSR